MAWEVEQRRGEGLPEQVLQVLGVLRLHPRREPWDPRLHGEQVGVGASSTGGRSTGSSLAEAETAWTNHNRPAAVGVELQRQLGRNQEQEVRLNVGHRLLHQCLFWRCPPVGGVNGEGRVHAGAPLLLGQTRQEAPDLGAEGAAESGPGGSLRSGWVLLATHAVVSFLVLMLGTSTPAKKCPSMLFTPAM